MADEIISTMKKYKYISPDYEKYLKENILNSIIDENIISIGSLQLINEYFSSNIYNNFIEKEKEIFVRSIVEYFDEHDIKINKPQTIFAIFTFINDKSFCPIFLKIYGNLDNFSKLQINYLFIIIIYLKLEKIIGYYENQTNVFDINLDYVSDKFNSISEIIIFAHSNLLIQNPIISTKEYIESMEYPIISLVDLLSYSIYTEKNKYLIIFVLKIIIQLIKNKPDEINKLVSNKINVDIFHFLYKHIDNSSDSIEEFDFIDDDNFLLINEIIEKFNPESIYKNTFGYMIHILLKNTTKDILYFDESAYEIIESIYTSDIFNDLSIVQLSNEIELREVISMVSDLELISNQNIYFRVISWIKNSKSITELKKIFILNVMFRYLESENDIIKYNVDSDYYYRNDKTGNEIVVDKNVYIDKCIKFINKQNESAKNNIILLLELYINNIYHKISELKDISDTNECVICMCEIIKNKKVCIGCNGFYHKKCIVKWYQDKNKSTCPKCRRNISSCIDLTPEEKINLFNSIISKLK